MNLFATQLSILLILHSYLEIKAQQTYTIFGNKMPMIKRVSSYEIAVLFVFLSIEVLSSTIRDFFQMQCRELPLHFIVI